MSAEMVMNNFAPSRQTLQSKSLQDKKGPPADLSSKKVDEMSFKDLMTKVEGKSKDAENSSDIEKLLQMLKLPPEDMKKAIGDLSEKELAKLNEMVQMALFNLLDMMHQMKNNSDFSPEDLGLDSNQLNQLKDRLSLMQQMINEQGLLENKSEGDFNTKLTKLLEKIDNNSSQLQSEGEKTAADMDKNEINTAENVNLSELTDKNLIGKNNEEFTELLQKLEAVDTEEIKLNSEGEKALKELKKLLSKLDMNVEQDVEQKVDLEKSLEGSDNKGQSVDSDFVKQLLENRLAGNDNRLEGDNLEFKGNSGEDNSTFEAVSRLSGELMKEMKSSTDLKDIADKLDLNQKTLQQLGISSGDEGVKAARQAEQFNSAQDFVFNTQQFTADQSTGFKQQSDILKSFHGSNPAEQVMERLQMLQKTGQNSLKLQLEPEFLGKVDLEMKVSDGDVTARFVVDNGLVKNHLDHNMPALRANLINQGFNVENIEVETNNNEFNLQEDGTGQQFSQQGDKDDQQHSFGYTPDYYTGLDGLGEEQLEKLITERPELLQRWNSGTQNNWMTLDGYYRRMNILA